MTTNWFIGLVGGVALSHVFRHYTVRYREWRAARTDAPFYPDWRGVFVQDLMLRRIERTLLWLFILLNVAAFVAGTESLSPGLWAGLLGKFQ